MIIGLVWGKFFVFKVAECILSVGGGCEAAFFGGRGDGKGGRREPLDARAVWWGL